MKQEIVWKKRGPSLWQIVDNNNDSGDHDDVEGCDSEEDDDEDGDYDGWQKRTWSWNISDSDAL